MYDLEILSVEPPKPFELVLPGWRIPKGSIRKCVGDNDWKPVSDFEEGEKAPKRTIAYAVLKTPDLYRLAEPNETVEFDDLFWDAESSSWQPWCSQATPLAGTVEQVAGHWDQPLYIAKLDESNEDSRTVRLPCRHRPLCAGESMRTGDLLICHGVREWQPVTRYLCGRLVRESREVTGYMRWCRPMGIEAFFIHVGESEQVDEVTGERVMDYPSPNAARDMLEAHAKAAAKPVVGAVLTHHGELLFAVDPAEPPKRFPKLTSSRC